MKRIFIFLGIIVALVLGIKASQMYSSSGRNIGESLQNIITQCEDESYTQSLVCFRKRVESLVRREGANRVIGELDTLFATQREEGDVASVSCHDVAHVVGEVATTNNEHIGEVLSQCTNACGYGCQHGTLLGAVKKNPKLLEDLSDVCTQVSHAPFHPQDYDACVHGLGHAVSDVANLDIPRAFALCDTLLLENDKKICADGVLMETIFAPSLGHESYQFPGTIYEFCHQFSGVYQDVCFETAGVYNFTFSEDPKQAIDVCSQIPSVYAKSCTVSLMNILYYALYGQPQQIITYCAALPSHLTVSCLLGAIQSDVVTNKDPKNSLALCALVNNTNRKECFRLLEEKVAYVHGEETQKKVCERFPNDMRALCTQ